MLQITCLQAHSAAPALPQCASGPCASLLAEVAACLFETPDMLGAQAATVEKVETVGEKVADAKERLGGKTGAVRGALSKPQSAMADQVCCCAALLERGIIWYGARTAVLHARWLAPAFALCACPGAHT